MPKDGATPSAPKGKIEFLAGSLPVLQALGRIDLGVESAGSQGYIGTNQNGNSGLHWISIVPLLEGSDIERIRTRSRGALHVIT